MAKMSDTRLQNSSPRTNGYRHGGYALFFLYCNGKKKWSILYQAVFGMCKNQSIVRVLSHRVLCSVFIKAFPSKHCTCAVGGEQLRHVALKTAAASCHQLIVAHVSLTSQRVKSVCVMNKHFILASSLHLQGRGCLSFALLIL